MAQGFERLAAAISGAVSGRPKQDAFAQESKSLANFDYLQAGARSRDASAEESIAQAMRERAHAGLYDAQAATAKGANELHSNSLNYAPIMAARSKQPLDVVNKYIGSLTGHGGPWAKPEIESGAERQLGELFASLKGLQFAGKGVGGEDIPAILSGSLRNAAGATAMDAAKTDPVKAAWQLSLANNKDEPKLYAANGDQGVYNTLTGHQSTVPGAPKGPKAPIGYQYKADGITLEPIPGGPAQVLIDERNLRRDDITDRRMLAKTDKEEKEVLRRSGDLDKKVTRFSGEMSKTGVPETSTLLGAIEGTMAKYNGKDLPGYGAIVGGLPDIAVSKEGKELRQEVAKLFNIVLKDRSGAAVTSQELDRLKQEFGTGTWRGDDQLRKGIQDYRREFDSLRQNVLAGVDVDVLDEYEARGGQKQPRANRTPVKPPVGASPQREPRPAVGAVVDGMRFKGGNPKSPGSWEPESKGRT